MKKIVLFLMSPLFFIISKEFVRRREADELRARIAEMEQTIQEIHGLHALLAQDLKKP